MQNKESSVSWFKKVKGECVNTHNDNMKHLSNHYNLGTVHIGKYMRTGKREWFFVCKSGLL